ETFGYYKERFKDALSNRFRFPVFDLSDEKMEYFLEKFKHTTFDYVYGYTSSVVLFAKFLNGKKLFLKQLCPSLKHCIVTSEMLFESDQKLLENQLGVPVINEYGASEADIIAFTDVQGKLALNQETLYIELLNENNQAATPGEEAKIVVSALYNTAHPFLRYEIGDLGIAEPHEGKIPRSLKTLVGRTNDIALLPNNKSVPGLSFYYVTKSIIEDAANIKEFVVEQLHPTGFEIHYVADTALSEKDAQKIQTAMDKYIGKNIDLKLIQKTQLDRSARGKLKQFLRRF
ncbi:MAG: phenylacetate--CoA ligase family protein, partial [Flavobacteriaceae bacterium]|nr:phenylacetate--CoA ligase family protein [Flavobacteriaceae bacterium]